MRILITGASGFAGQHLIRYLQENQPAAQLYGTVLRAGLSNLLPAVAYTRVDLCDAEAVRRLLEETRPDVIYHLAGQASPGRSYQIPWATLEANVHPQFNLLQACVDMQIAPRIVVVTSAEVYGKVKPEELPLTETAELRPSNPYSLSKITQDMMAWHYFTCYQLPVIRARSFNHAGTGQSEEFVVASFATQIARIESGSQEILKVGNLTAQRDFTDVRDMVRAYALLAEQGAAGEAYNIASGKPYSIQALLDLLLGLAKTKVHVELDPKLMRPLDIPIIQGSYARLQQATGWQPRIPFEQTLSDVLEDSRQRVLNSLRS